MVNGRHGAKAANRSRYTGDAETRCEETKAKLAIVTAQIRVAGITGSVETNKQLMKAQFQAETHLATMRRRLERLKLADDQSWPRHKQDVEDGWENLLRSIKNIVTKLSSM